MGPRSPFAVPRVRRRHPRSESGREPVGRLTHPAGLSCGLGPLGTLAPNPVCRRAKVPVPDRLEAIPKHVPDTAYAKKTLSMTPGFISPGR
jgi:hypothetical protein